MIMNKQKEAVIIHGSKWRPIPFGNGGSFTMWRNYMALTESFYKVKLFEFGSSKPSLKYPKKELAKLSYKTIKTSQNRFLFKGRISKWLNAPIGLLRGFYPPGTGDLSVDNDSILKFSKMKPDLIVAQNISAAITSRRIWKKSKIVLCLHDIDPILELRKSLNSLEHNNPFKKNVFYKLFFKWNYFFHITMFKYHCRSFDDVTVHGENMIKDMNRYHLKAKYFPPVVLQKNYILKNIRKIRSECFNNEVIRIVYISKLNNSHTRRALPKIIENILPKFEQTLGADNFILRVIGSQKNAKDIIKKYSKIKNVDFIGFVDDLDEEYNKAFCQIVPDGFDTGVRIKIIESLSYGLPIITTSKEISALRLTDNKSGCLSADNDDQFVSQMVRLIKEKNFYFENVENALSTFNEKFHQKNIIPKISDYFKKISIS